MFDSCRGHPVCSPRHDEVLNGEEFASVVEARVVISQWLVQCNTVRPHRGSGC